MPLEVGSVVNSCAECVASNRLICKVLGNPLFTALLVTALAMVIIWSLYKEELRDTKRKRALKAFIYVSFAVSVLLFVHYYIIRRSLDREFQREGVREVFASVHTSAELKGSEGAKGIAGVTGAGDALEFCPEGTKSQKAGPPAAAAAETSETPPDNIAPDELDFEEVALSRPKVAEVQRKK